MKHPNKTAAKAMKHPTHNSILSWDVPCSARLPASFFAVLEEPSAQLGAMFGAKGTGATKVQQRAFDCAQQKTLLLANTGQ